MLHKSELLLFEALFASLEEDSTKFNSDNFSRQLEDFGIGVVVDVVVVVIVAVVVVLLS